MNNEKFSLCIPCYNYIENRVDNLMWRIADFSSENNVLYPAVYTVDGDNEYLPRKLSVNAYSVQQFKPSIYRWSRNEKLKVRSNDTEICPMEIVKLSDSILENHNTDIKIREILYTGIPFYEHISNDFLLVVNEDDNYYEALKFKRTMSCISDKNMFKIEKICQDMLRATHKVELITFLKKDVIDTQESNIRSGAYTYAPIRCFYKYLDLPRASREFELREPRDYAKAFVSKYVKTRQEVLATTNKDRQRLSNIIDIALHDKKEIADFYRETGYSSLDMEYGLSDLKTDVIEILVGSNSFSKIIEDIFLRSEDLKTNFIDIAKKLWVAEATELMVSIEKDIQDRDDKLKKSTIEYTSLLNKIDKIKLETTEIENKYTSKEQEFHELNNRLEEVKSNIQRELNKFQTDIVHLAAMSALSNTQATQQLTKIGFILQKGVELDDLEFDAPDTLKTFAEDLQENLEISGIISDVTAAVSQIIACTLVSGRNLILDANSDNVSDAISSLLDGNHATKIFITDSIVDVKALIENINSISSRAVLIHGLLNTFNERMFVTLSQLCKEKFLIFACEDVDTFDALPSHWWKYATLLSLRSTVTIHTEEKYMSYRIGETLFENDKDSNFDVEDIKRTISKYIKSNNLPHVQALAIRQLFSISKKHLKDFSIMQKYLFTDETVDIEDFELSEV